MARRIVVITMLFLGTFAFIGGLARAQQEPAIPASPSVRQTTQATVQGVTAAASELAGTMAAGGKALAAQGRKAGAKALELEKLEREWLRLAGAARTSPEGLVE